MKQRLEMNTVSLSNERYLTFRDLAVMSNIVTQSTRKTPHPASKPESLICNNNVLLGDDAM